MNTYQDNSKTNATDRKVVTTEEEKPSVKDKVKEKFHHVGEKVGIVKPETKKIKSKEVIADDGTKKVQQEVKSHPEHVGITKPETDKTKKTEITDPQGNKSYEVQHGKEHTAIGERDYEDKVRGHHDASTGQNYNEASHHEKGLGGRHEVVGGYDNSGNSGARGVGGVGNDVNARPGVGGVGYETSAHQPGTAGAGYDTHSAQPGTLDQPTFTEAKTLHQKDHYDPVVGQHKTKVTEETKVHKDKEHHGLHHKDKDHHHGHKEHIHEDKQGGYNDTGVGLKGVGQQENYGGAGGQRTEDKHHEVGVGRTGVYDDKHREVGVGQTGGYDEKHREIGVGHTGGHDDKHREIGVGQTGGYDNRQNVGQTGGQVIREIDIEIKREVVGGNQGVGQTGGYDNRQNVGQTGGYDKHHEIGVGQTGGHEKHHELDVGVGKTGGYDKHHELGVGQTGGYDKHRELDVGVGHGGYDNRQNVGQTGGYDNRQNIGQTGGYDKRHELDVGVGRHTAEVGLGSNVGGNNVGQQVNGGFHDTNFSRNDERNETLINQNVQPITKEIRIKEEVKRDGTRIVKTTEVLSPGANINMDVLHDNFGNQHQNISNQAQFGGPSGHAGVGYDASLGNKAQYTDPKVGYADGGRGTGDAKVHPA